MRKYLIVCMALASLLGAAGAASPGAIAAPAVNSKSAPPLRPAVEAHLAAIAARDLDALLPTITSATDLVMIAPNGFKFDTRAQYVDFHRQWFASKDQGKLSAEIVHLIESPALGHALTGNRVLYRDGVPVAAYVAGEVRFLTQLDPKEQWEAQNAILRRHVPAALADLA